MLTKTLLMGATAVMLLSVPAMAQNATSGSTGGTRPLTKSDEDFLAKLSDADFNDVTGKASNPNDADNDGIADSGTTMADLNKAVMPKLVGSEDEDAKKPKQQVKYVYNPESDTTLRRTLVDPRMGDDGYVQGLMKQRGPQ